MAGYEQIPDPELEEAVLAVMRSVPSAADRVYESDRSTMLTLGQIADLLNYAPEGGPLGWLAHYLGHTKQDSDRAKFILVTHRWGFTCMLKFDQKRDNGDGNPIGSEFWLKHMVRQMSDAFDLPRSFGYGMMRVKSGLFQVSRDFFKERSEKIGAFHVAQCRLSVDHWYFKKAC